MKLLLSYPTVLAIACLLNALLHNEPSFADGCLAPNLAGARTYDAGTSPVSVAVGDFNGDGQFDMAVANSGSANVSVLLGRGDGSFQAAVNYGAGSSPRSVAVGDFNADSKPDPRPSQLWRRLGADA